MTRMGLNTVETNGIMRQDLQSKTGRSQTVLQTQTQIHEQNTWGEDTCRENSTLSTRTKTLGTKKTRINPKHMMTPI